MGDTNFMLAWIWFLAGAVTGTTQGLFFHNEQWMGGYSSWRRRLTRLGHISFFGTGLLNLAFALSLTKLQQPGRAIDVASVLLIVGAIAMPTVCYLAAWRPFWRNLFAIPVGSLMVGVAIVVVDLIFN